MSLAVEKIMGLEHKDWFKDWFNSPYYHILYQHRDFKEAEIFVNNLSTFLQIQAGERILDVPCGKGRHSIQLNKKGYDVTGLDLAQENIRFAKKFSNESLRFFVHDMREPFLKEQFSFVFNLFTSFGYFINEEDNLKTLQMFASSLKKGGKLVIDFLNTEKVLKNLIPSEHKTLSGIDFHITKELKDDHIIKNIQFFDKGINFSYEEIIKAIRKEEFLSYFNHYQLKILNIFGDYSLNEFSPEKSDRMIFILEK